MVCPGVTVSRLVPSASISAIRFACAEADTPTTATIAPIPIAIPNADSAARSLLVRNACSAVESSREGGSRARGDPLGAGCGRGGHSRSSETISPSRIGSGAGSGGDRLLVGDQHERGAVGGELTQKVDDLAARCGVEVAGRLVGEHDHRALGDRSRDRDPLALTAGQHRRPMRQTMAETHPLERARAASRRCASGCPAYSIPSATLSSALTASWRWNSWNTNPIAYARSPASSTSDVRRGRGRRRARRRGSAARACPSPSTSSSCLTPKGRPRPPARRWHL